MFFTERLMLRAIDPEVDNATWLQWTNNVQSINAVTNIGPHPWSREKSKALLENRAKKEDALPWFIICERPAPGNEPASVLGPNDDYFKTADGKARYPAIGMLTLSKMGGAIDVNRTVSFGIMFDQAHQGKGLGPEVLRWLCEYVFSTLGYHRIELKLDATNAKALSCYRKVGFVEEGRLRKHFWREGTWRDTLEMAMLEEEWFAEHRPQVE